MSTFHDQSWTSSQPISDNRQRDSSSRSDSLERCRHDFEDGGAYTGQWKRGSAHGLGLASGPHDRDLFAGQWTEGFERSGVYLWPNGNLYAGLWFNGKRHGEGVQVKGKWTFCGQFNAGCCGPLGVQQGSSGHQASTYEGSWYQNRFDGHGIESCADGSIYAGAWVKGQRHGCGVRLSYVRPPQIKPPPKRSLKSFFATSSNSSTNSAIAATPSPQRSITDLKTPPPSTSTEPTLTSPRQSTSSRPSGDSQTLSINRSRVSTTNTTSGSRKAIIGRAIMRKLRRQASAVEFTGSTSSPLSSCDRSDGTVEAGKSLIDTGVDSDLVPIVELYAGQWVDDRRCGVGLVKRSNGFRYVGEWWRNQRHGYGVAINPDGSRDEGQFSADNISVRLNRKARLQVWRQTKLHALVEQAVERAITAANEARNGSLEKAFERASEARQVMPSVQVEASKARNFAEQAIKLALQIEPSIQSIGRQLEKAMHPLTNLLTEVRLDSDQSDGDSHVKLRQACKRGSWPGHLIAQSSSNRPNDQLATTEDQNNRSPNALMDDAYEQFASISNPRSRRVRSAGPARVGSASLQPPQSQRPSSSLVRRRGRVLPIDEEEGEGVRNHRHEDRSSNDLVSSSLDSSTSSRTSSSLTTNPSRDQIAGQSMRVYAFDDGREQRRLFKVDTISEDAKSSLPGTASISRSHESTNHSECEQDSLTLFNELPRNTDHHSSKKFTCPASSSDDALSRFAPVSVEPRRTSLQSSRDRRVKPPATVKDIDGKIDRSSPNDPGRKIPSSRRSNTSTVNRDHQSERPENRLISHPDASDSVFVPDRRSSRGASRSNRYHHHSLVQTLVEQAEITEGEPQSKRARVPKSNGRRRSIEASHASREILIAKRMTNWRPKTTIGYSSQTRSNLGKSTIAGYWSPDLTNRNSSFQIRSDFYNPYRITSTNSTPEDYHYYQDQLTPLYPAFGDAKVSEEEEESDFSSTWSRTSVRSVPQNQHLSLRSSNRRLHHLTDPSNDWYQQRPYPHDNIEDAIDRQFRVADGQVSRPSWSMSNYRQLGGGSVDHRDESINIASYGSRFFSPEASHRTRVNNSTLFSSLQHQRRTEHIHQPISNFVSPAAVIRPNRILPARRGMPCPTKAAESPLTMVDAITQRPLVCYTDPVPLDLGHGSNFGTLSQPPAFGYTVATSLANQNLFDLISMTDRGHRIASQFRQVTFANSMVGPVQTTSSTRRHSSPSMSFTNHLKLPNSTDAIQPNNHRLLLPPPTDAANSLSSSSCSSSIATLVLGNSRPGSPTKDRFSPRRRSSCQLGSSSSRSIAPSTSKSPSKQPSQSKTSQSPTCLTIDVYRHGQACLAALAGLAGQCIEQTWRWSWQVVSNRQALSAMMTSSLHVS